MTNTPLISIIIPTYNRTHLIGETLDSVLAQTYANWECIVVDDGSTDNTDEVLKNYCQKDKRIQYHHRPIDRPKGANACRNYGFELSKGKYIQFLDSDDVLESFCFEERVAYYLRDSSLDLLIRDTGLLNDSVKIYKSINKDPDKSDRENYLRLFLCYDIPWHTSSCLYSKKLLNICRFDENLSRFQDVSFNIKILSIFKNIKLLRDFKIDAFYRVDKHKIYNTNFRNKVLHSLLDFYKIHSDLLNTKEFKPEFRKFNNKIINEFVIPFFNKNKKRSNQVFLWSIKSGIYNFETKILFLLMMLFMNLGIFKIKGIGMYRFYKTFSLKIN